MKGSFPTWSKLPALCFAALVVALCMFMPAQAQDSSAEAQDQSAQTSESVILPDVAGLRVANAPDRARLVIDLGSETQFAFVSLADPMRIAVDVRATGHDGATAGEPAGEGLIEHYTVEQIADDRLRTTLVLAAPAQVQQAYVLDAFDDQPARLIVDLIEDSTGNFARRAAADLAGATDSNASEIELTDNSNAPGTSNVVRATRPLILIDPGHGGLDGGAETENGIEEKIITLAFARRLQEILINSGQFDVALTRDNDQFLRLEDRVQLARDNKANLFISIHADAFEDHTVRGASVYTRDEQATDVLDHVLAEQENKADLVGGFTPPEAEPAVVDLLVELMRRQTRRQSYVAASAVMDQLRPSIYARRFPMRRADFYVLQSPEVPSLLLELGFLSNEEDAQNLSSPDWRDRVAEAVARGIALYFDGLAGT